MSVQSSFTWEAEDYLKSKANLGFHSDQNDMERPYFKRNETEMVKQDTNIFL